MGRSLIVIPAHLDSQRLPGKALLKHKGRTLLEWTYRQALKCHTSADVVVTTSDDEIADVVRDFNGICVHTPGVEFPNGTNRAFAAYDWVSDVWHNRHYQSLIVWQADEPCIDPYDVYVLQKCLTDEHHSIKTMVAPMDSLLDLPNPNSVKAVLVEQDRVAWFTRAPLIYAYTHVGIYAFSIRAVSLLPKVPIPQCVKDESLEQLAWLSAGWDIGAIKLKTCAPLSINTQDDWDRFTQQ